MIASSDAAGAVVFGDNPIPIFNALLTKDPLGVLFIFRVRIAQLIN